MPLKLATVGRHRTISALAKALYSLRDDTELQARAEAALLKANPHLADRLAAGATVVVPDVAGLSTTEAASSLPVHPGPFDDIERDSVARLAKVAERLVGVAAEDGKAQRVRLKDPEFVAALARIHPELGQKLPEITEAVAADAKRLQLRARQLQEAVQLVQADLERQASRGHS